MQPTLTHRLAALVAAVTATFSLVWAHASLAYPAMTASTIVLAQACSR
jgi:hypothetical protein